MTGKLRERETSSEKKAGLRKMIKEIERKVVKDEYNDRYHLCRDLIIRHHIKELLFDIESGERR